MLTMKTLILGHGRKYSKTDVRCSPCDIDEWYNDDYVCVDILHDLNPDIVYDLRKKEWTFCKENEYDRIIDTSGLALYGTVSKPYKECTQINILHALNENWGFYGRKNICWKKQNGVLVDYTK